MPSENPTDQTEEYNFEIILFAISVLLILFVLVMSWCDMVCRDKGCCGVDVRRKKKYLDHQCVTGEINFTSAA